MRRKLFSFVIVGSMLMSSLVGCSSESNNEIVDMSQVQEETVVEQNNTQVEENTVEEEATQVEETVMKEKTEEEPLQSDFEKYGIPCNVLLDQEFEYDNVCIDDTTKDSILKGLYTNYKCFVSDDTHEAKEGYVWQTFMLKLTIDDENGWRYGTGSTWNIESYYDIVAFQNSVESLEDENGWSVFKFSQNYNGKNYDECLFKRSASNWIPSEYWEGDFWDESIPRYQTKEMYFEVCVPENSEGMVIVLRNERLTGEYVDYFFNMNNLDSVEAFRLPKAIPN